MVTTFSPKASDSSGSQKRVLMKAEQIFTIRSTLALLVAACVLLALLMAVVLISYYYQHGKNQLVSNSIIPLRTLMDRSPSGGFGRRTLIHYMNLSGGSTPHS